MTKILSEKEIKSALKELPPGWIFEDDKIKKEFSFEDFLDALKFLNKMAPTFERESHHPDTHIFYNNILFELSRFDVGGKVTDRDFKVAREIENLFAKHTKK